MQQIYAFEWYFIHIHTTDMPLYDSSNKYYLYNIILAL